MRGMFFKTIRFFAFSRNAWKAFAVLFLLSLLATFLPVFATQGDTGRGRSQRVGWIDEDRSLLSAQLTEDAEKDSVLTVSYFDEANKAEAMNLLSSGVMEALFVIPKGYAEKLQSGQYKESVSLYFSPYSTLGKTLSDSFGALIFRQFIQSAVILRAGDYAGSAAADDAKALFENPGKESILRIQTIRADGTPEKSNESLVLSAYLAAMLAAFYLLCVVSLPQNMPGIAERMRTHRSSAGAFAFAFDLAHALPFASSAVLFAVYVAFAAGAGAAFVFLASFLAYLLCLVALLLLIGHFALSQPARISMAAAFCLLNAVFAWPSGIAVHWMNFLFPAALLTEALKTPLLIVALLAYAAVVFIPGYCFIKKSARSYL